MSTKIISIQDFENLRDPKSSEYDVEIVRQVCSTYLVRELTFLYFQKDFDSTDISLTWHCSNLIKHLTMQYDSTKSSLKWLNNLKISYQQYLETGFIGWLNCCIRQIHSYFSEHFKNIENPHPNDTIDFKIISRILFNLDNALNTLSGLEN